MQYKRVFSVSPYVEYIFVRDVLSDPQIRIASGSYSGSRGRATLTANANRQARGDCPDGLARTRAHHTACTAHYDLSQHTI